MLSATAVRRPLTAKKSAVAVDFPYQAGARVLVACVDLHLARHIHKRARRCRQNEPRRRFENPSRGDITLSSSVCSCGQHASHADRDEALSLQHQQLTRVLETAAAGTRGAKIWQSPIDPVCDRDTND
jgi:hypothetical protein